jgi:glucosyl-dolichyl phosphate glucuronosyltransferase
MNISKGMNRSTPLFILSEAHGQPSNRDGQPGKSPTPLSVSVIICAYTGERWDQLLGAIRSVQAQTMKAMEIIVVVDHEVELLDRLRTAVGSDVTVLENRERRGLSGARNTGTAVACGDLVAFLDDDAEAAPDWLEVLTEGYENPAVVGTGGFVEPVWSRPAPDFPAEFNWVVGCTYVGTPTETSFVRNMIGANMSFRREVINRVGGFAHGIGRVGLRPVGCEETELCIRIRQSSSESRVLYEPRAVVRHHVPSSRLGWKYFVARCYSEGLSKALLCRLGGVEDGLSSERSYVLRALPRGFLRGLSDGLLRDDKGGYVRSAWIAGGLLSTLVGYVIGSAKLKLRGPDA